MYVIVFFTSSGGFRFGNPITSAKPAMATGINFKDGLKKGSSKEMRKNKPFIFLGKLLNSFTPRKLSKTLY